MHSYNHGALWLTCVLLSGDLCAQDTPSDQRVSPPNPIVQREVYLPYHALGTVIDHPAQERTSFLPQSTLEEILKRVQDLDSQSTTALEQPTTSLESARFEATANESNLVAKVTFKIVKTTEATWARFILGPRALPITEASLGENQIRYAEDQTELWISSTEPQDISLTLTYGLTKQARGYQAALCLPNLPLDTVSLRLPEGGWQFTSTPAIAIEQEESVYTLSPGGLETLTLQWQRPPPQHLAHVTAHSVTNLFILPRHLETECQLTLNVQRAPLKTLAIQLPPGHQLLSLKTPTESPWTVDGHRLTITPQTPLLGSHQLTLSLLAPLPELPQVVEITAPGMEDAAHQHGEIHLARKPTIAAATPEASDFFPLPPSKDTAPLLPIASYRFSGAPGTIRLPLSISEPSVSLESETHWHLGEQTQQLTSQIQFEVSDSPITSLSLELPEGFQNIELEDSSVLHHRLTENTLHITFRQPQLGRGGFHFRASRDIEALSLTEAPIETKLLGSPDSVRHLRRLLVSADEAFELSTTGLGDLVPIDARHHLLSSTNQGNSAPRFGFRYRGATPRPATLQLSKRAAKVTVEVAVEVKIAQHEIRHQWHLNYQFTQSPSEQVFIAVPKTHAETLQLTDERLKEVVKTAAPSWPSLPASLQDTHLLWRAAFRQGQRGEVSLLLTHSEALPAETSSFTKTVPQVIPIGTDLAKGTLGIYPSGELDVTAATDMDITDPSELPQAQATLAYRFGEQPSPVELSIQRHEFFAVPRLIIPYAEMEIAMDRDGGSTSQLVLFLKNRTESHLTLSLPQGARLVTDILVDGKAQTPRVDAASNDLILNLSMNEEPATLRAIYHVPEHGEALPMPEVTNGRILRSVVRVHASPSRRYHVQQSQMEETTAPRAWDRFRSLCQSLVPAIGFRREAQARSITTRPKALQLEARPEWEAFRPKQSQLLQFHRMGPPSSIHLASRSAILTNALEIGATLGAFLLALTLAGRHRGHFLIVVAAAFLVLSGLVAIQWVPIFQLLTLAVLPGWLLHLILNRKVPMPS